MNLSENGLQLLLDHEVGGGKPYYDKQLSRPSWPGEASGVTIGVGFDLGYNNIAQYTAAWIARLPEGHFQRLKRTLGLTGDQAKTEVEKLDDIVIPWDRAFEVFLDVSVPRFWLLTLKTYPRTIYLPEDAQAVLLSLIFNRGGSLSGDRRVEMRQIADDLQAEAYDKVPGRLRAMKRLWKPTSGLVRRREDEAKLWEKAFA
jgi:hypothetical protein